MSVFSVPLERLRLRGSVKWRAFPPDVLPLWVAEMDVDLLPQVRSAIDDALALGDTGYPFGNDYAEAFAQMAHHRWNWDLDVTAQVRRGGDVMNNILNLLETTTDPGDGIVINYPVYPPFQQVTSGYRRRLIDVPLTAAARLDLEALEQAFASEAPRAYLLCSPHNPTGTVHTREELAGVAALCREYNVTLVVDEIHACLVDPGTPFVPLLTVPGAEAAISIFSAGKAWNLAAFKAGLYIFGPEATDLARRLPPLANQSTGYLGSIAHTAALRHGQDWVDAACAEVAEHKQLLADLLTALVPAARYTPTPGTYLAWVDCSDLGLRDPAAEFVSRGRVAFSPGANFGALHRDWVRINLATSPAIITEAVERMASTLRGQESKS